MIFCLLSSVIFFFFFKQKTAYEMRISDWSSDVCSSDLVDHGVFHVGLLRAGLENPNENIGFDPITVSLEDGVPVAEGARQVAPRAARAHHPQHRFDEEPVVASAASRVRRLSQAMRFHLRPLGVSQYKSFHPKLESQTSSTWNPKSQQALGAVALRDHLLGQAAGQFLQVVE